MPILPSSYSPPLWLRNGHVNTLWPALFRKIEPLPAERVRLEMPDGDFVDVDILRSSMRRGSAGGKADKVAILSHGLEGNTRRAYMQGMARALLAAGWDVVGRNMRGCSGELARFPNKYYMGETGDLHDIALYCMAQGWKTVVMGGFSMGGAQTLKYLGEDPGKVPPAVKAGFGISVPCDLVGASRRLSSPQCAIYMKYFMRTMLPRMRAMAAKHKNFPSLEGLEHIRTFNEFDARFTAPINGFSSALDYWTRCACLPHVENIAVPTLLVNAGDDPFLTPSCTPHEQARRSQHLFLEAPRHGGHVGFAGGGPRYWTESRVVDFLQRADV